MVIMTELLSFSPKYPNEYYHDIKMKESYGVLYQEISYKKIWKNENTKVYYSTIGGFSNY